MQCQKLSPEGGGSDTGSGSFSDEGGSRSCRRACDNSWTMARISAVRAATDVPCSAGETVDRVNDVDDEAGGSFPESALFFDILPVLGEACVGAC